MGRHVDICKSEAWDGKGAVSRSFEKEGAGRKGGTLTSTLEDLVQLGLVQQLRVLGLHRLLRREMRRVDKTRVSRVAKETLNVDAPLPPQPPKKAPCRGAPPWFFLRAGIGLSCARVGRRHAVGAADAPA